MRIALRIQVMYHAAKKMVNHTQYIYMQVCVDVKSTVFRGAGVTCTVACFPHYCPFNIIKSHAVRCLELTHWEDTCWVEQAGVLCPICSIPGHLPCVHQVTNHSYTTTTLKRFSYLFSILPFMLTHCTFSRPQTSGSGNLSLTPSAGWPSGSGSRCNRNSATWSGMFMKTQKK